MTGVHIFYFLGPGDGVLGANGGSGGGARGPPPLNKDTGPCGWGPQDLVQGVEGNHTVNPLCWVPVGDWLQGLAAGQAL